MILRLHAVVAQDACPGRQRVVAGRDHAAVARAAQVLRRIKTETTHDAHRTCAPPIVVRANRLRGIFDDRNAASFADVEQRIHLRTLAVEMYRHDHFRARRDRVSNH